MTADITPVDSKTMERIVPDELSRDQATGSETLALHLERYRFAQQYLVPGSVLDIACGVGYGTVLLAESSVATETLGVDIDINSIDYARKRYGRDRVSYACSDALRFAPNRQFENIVSLETIEHVDDPRSLFGHLVSLLTAKGRLVASVPTTPSVDANPHHKSNFSKRNFLNFGDTFSLKYIASLQQNQSFNPVAVSLYKEARTVNLRQSLWRFYLDHPSHLALRLWSTLRDGFVNKYITVVWEK